MEDETRLNPTLSWVSMKLGEAHFFLLRISALVLDRDHHQTIDQSIEFGAWPRTVLWRKCCFGSQSGRGLRFVERMLTITETYRQNQTNVLDHLKRAIAAHRKSGLVPRLQTTD